MIPAKLHAGDSFSALEQLAAHPASAGWVAYLRLVARTHGNTAVTIDGTAEGDAHRLVAAAGSTAAWAADAYTWVLWVEKGAEVVTVSQGQLQVLPNLREATAGADGRSLARRTLDDLMAAKAQWDTSGGRTRSYKIGDREMEFNSEAEIIKKIVFWESQVQREEDTARQAAGGRPRNRILTRFVRPR